MTTLTELNELKQQVNELEQQVKESSEKLQKLYFSVEYADYEIQHYVKSMADHISQIECFKALVTLEIFTARNKIRLKDLAVGTKVEDTEPFKIETTYLRTDWLFKNKERKDRLWIDIKEQEVVGIYYDYKYID